MSGFDLTRFASKRSKRAKHIIKDGKRYLEREGLSRSQGFFIDQPDVGLHRFLR